MPSDPEPSSTDWHGGGRREEEEEGRESCGASGSAARRRRRFQAGRCLAGLLGKPQTSGILVGLSFSSGSEAHAVAWYVIFETVDCL